MFTTETDFVIYLTKNNFVLQRRPSTLVTDSQCTLTYINSFLLAWMLARVGHDVGRSWGDWRKPTCPSRRPMYPIIYNNCRSWGLNLGRSGDKQVHCPLHNWTPLSSF